MWPGLVNLGFKEKYLGFSGFYKIYFIFRKVPLGVAYLQCRQYARNPTAALTTHLDEVADLVKLT